MRRPCGWLPIVGLFVIAGCASGARVGVDEPTIATDEPLAVTETAGPAEPLDAAAFDHGAEPDLARLQADGFCDPEDFADDGAVTAMSFVVQSELQPECFGEPDPRLQAAWRTLTAVTPAELSDDISLFVGFESCDTCTTMAYVTALDDASLFFAMAIDVVSGADDPDELALTMQHELSHVFTQTPVSQLDVAVDSSGCTTYYNGVGCLTDGSYMWAWIQQFWDDEALATITDGKINRAAGRERCVVGASFTGPYGASSPEEDFADVFSAYVFDVDVGPALAAKLAFFDDYPEFVQVRANAEAAGLWDRSYIFAAC